MLTSEGLSELYGTRVDVVRLEDRVFVAGVPDGEHHHIEAHVDETERLERQA